jgi:hypothetical protein
MSKTWAFVVLLEYKWRLIFYVGIKKREFVAVNLSAVTIFSAVIRPHNLRLHDRRLNFCLRYAFL